MTAVWRNAHSEDCGETRPHYHRDTADGEGLVFTGPQPAMRPVIYDLPIPSNTPSGLPPKPSFETLLPGALADLAAKEWPDREMPPEGYPVHPEPGDRFEETAMTPVQDGCPICKGTERRVAGGLTGWHDQGHPERDTPSKLAVDAAGYVWRVFEGAGMDGDDLWSMAPQNPDNAPIPGPVTYYVPVAAVRLATATSSGEETSPHPVGEGLSGLLGGGLDGGVFVGGEPHGSVDGSGVVAGGSAGSGCHGADYSGKGKSLTTGTLATRISGMTKHMTEAKAHRLIAAIEAICQTVEYEDGRVDAVALDDARAAVDEWA